MRRLRRGSGLVLCMLWLLMADLATAGDYVLVIGKGFEVCESYLENLNSFPNHPPMVCDRSMAGLRTMWWPAASPKDPEEPHR